MLGGFVSGLLVAWILQLFGVGNMVLDVFQPFTIVKLTLSHYYIGFGLIGFISGAITIRL